MNLHKIPATVVTGFLGSGKTTLLSNVIRQARGRRIAVIVNEFGELDIDADLLRSCPLECEDGTVPSAAPVAEEGVYELANGCICCTVEEEFLPVMKQLVARSGEIDHILIETSGLALPKPLIQAFNWPEITQHCTVDSVITVVDGPAVAEGHIASDPDRVQAQRAADERLDHDPSLRELLEDQLGSADLVLISKVDKLTGKQLDKVRESILQQVDPRVKVLEVENGRLRSELIMGLMQASENRIEALHTHHDRHHHHDEEHVHAHEHFDSVCIELGDVDSDRVTASVAQLIRDHAIIRVKGFLSLPGKPMRQVFQGVGNRIDRYFDRPWHPNEERKGRMVFIGKGLDEETLRKHLLENVV
ncbi:MAG: cobalamin biosynthesis protein CobW [Gammaproteobacteria bacterium]|nr:cobalamin biosynthesis protein CobW [Gammaproteobacteria bacterium]